MKNKAVIYLNGKFITEEEAKISALGPGSLYGWGLFETMRAYKNKIPHLNEHLARIKNSSVLLRVSLTYTPDKLKNAIKEAIITSGLKDACVRLGAWKSLGNKADVAIVVKEYKPMPEVKYRQGFSCMVSEYRQNDHSILPRHKTANYLFYQLAWEEAKAKGFDEAIIINNSGYIAEASHANLFLVKNKTLFTPALECGCLDGITRKIILDFAKKEKISVQEGNFTLQHLYDSQEAFLTNSLMGIMPIKSIENIALGERKSKDTLTGYFIRQYKILLKNGS